MAALFAEIWRLFEGNLDRIFAVIAIVIATYAILDVRKLFKELNRRDENTETRIRQEVLTHFASYATFSYAAQFIDFVKGQPDKDACIAMLKAFHTLKLLNPNLTREQAGQLRKDTRDKINKEAVEWARLIVDCGLGTMKDGWDFPPKQRE